MAPFGLKLWENAFQTIPNISFFDAESIKKIDFLKNFEAIYSSRMAPFGLKLWENAFQMISNISFFDVEKMFSAKFFVENKFHDTVNINRHFLKNYDKRPRKNYDWIGFWNESWDVRHNSSKSGV